MAIENFQILFLGQKRYEKEKKWGDNNFGLTWLTKMTYSDSSVSKII